jgi:hypothetical protein
MVKKTKPTKFSQPAVRHQHLQERLILWLPLQLNCFSFCQHSLHQMQGLEVAIDISGAANNLVRKNTNRTL